MSSGNGSTVEPLGANGDPRRRFWFHHVPLAVGSAVVLALCMGLPVFDVNAYEHGDVSSGIFPRRGVAAAGGDAREGPTGRIEARPDHSHRMGHGASESNRHRGHGTEVHGGALDATRTRQGADGIGGHVGEHGDRERADIASSRSAQQLTVATGYLGVMLLAVTLLLGPANLLLGRRNPISSYLRRDVGIWAAIFSAVHVAAAVLIHVSHGSGVTQTALHFFLNQNGRLLTNSFGLGNWTGLAALAIALVLLAISNDAALRRMKARPWKWVQRLTYGLFGLVVLHAFFYGALLRMTSPFTQVLILSVATVVVGQLIGVWLSRRRLRVERRWHVENA